jgi:putative transposase
MATIPNSANSGSSRFQRIVDALLAQPGVPFANVLSAERIERIFDRRGNRFGAGASYSTAVMVWSFLGQVLRDGKAASCQSAVARIVTYCPQQELAAPTADSGDYCPARAKLSEAALRALSREVARQVERQADANWLGKGRHAKLVDGFTFTMPDTKSSQAEDPSPKTQKPGVGLPIARAAVILSLATACALDVAVGPDWGKQTGETALLRQLLDSFAAGDVAVIDRFYGSFRMIASLLGQHVHVCARRHHRRHVDFRRGRRLGKDDHRLMWTTPQRPAWMDQATYDPDTREMRELRYHVVQPGRRTKTVTSATTLTDAETYSKEDIAQLWLPLELGVGYPIDQAIVEPDACPLEVAGDGPPGTVDHAAGLPPDPHDRRRRDAGIARQAGWYQVLAVASCIARYAVAVAIRGVA